jgi:DNA-binding MarR family transcriptional regulator
LSGSDFSLFLLVRFDEPFRLPQTRSMPDDPVFAILRAYPQIYLACHVEHRTRASSNSGLTSRDAAFLAHLDDAGSSAGALARHLGIAKSTLSAALARLAAEGLVLIDDRRRKRIFLTAAGKQAMADASVLDPARLSQVLAQLTPRERNQAVRGLTLLARAAARFRGMAPPEAEELA